MATESLTPEATFRLRDYFGILRARKWSVIVITVLATGGAVFYAKNATPVYQSQSRVEATNPLASILSQNPNAAGPNLPTEQSLVSSTTVTKCAYLLFRSRNGDPTQLCTADALAKLTKLPGVFRSEMSTSVPPSANILIIAYSDSHTPVAQAGAEAFARSYVWYKTLVANQKVAEIRDPLLKQEDQLSKQISQVNASLLKAIAGGNTNSAGAAQTQLNGLNNQLQVVEQQLINTSPAKIDPPVIVADAPFPAAPVSPNKPLIAAVGLLIGLAFGIGLAFLREQLDDRLRGRADLEEKLGAPILAVIPKVPGWKRRTETKLVSAEQPKSAIAEAYRTLRTSILFAAGQRGLKTLMVVSGTAGDGKTTTAANLAVVLADAGKRTILVSADLRKPRIHRFFDLNNELGLSDVLAGEMKPWEGLQDPSRDNLRVMVSGPVPGSPGEMLQSQNMGELIAELRDVADFVILDTAPILLVADALTLAPFVDGVLFVADDERSSRGAVLHARERLEQVGATVIGAVLNNFDPARARAYPYYSGYYYYGQRRYRYGLGYGSYYGSGYYSDGKHGDLESGRPVPEPVRPSQEPSAAVEE